MARSRSRSRDRSRRKYSSSDESDYDRRKRNTKKKRRGSRSRSRSIESDRRRYRSRESTRYRSSYDDDSRSSSRSERRDSKKRNSRRDRSRNRSPSDRSRTEREGVRTGRSASRERSKRGSTDWPKDSPETESDKIPAGGDIGLSFKERVAKLASSSSEKPDDKRSIDADYKIDSEKVAEIDSQGFRQEAFSSNALNKGVNRNGNDKSTAESNAMDEQDNHVGAIFGSSSTITATSLAKTIGSPLLNQDTSDDIFGPSLLIDQSKRTERWLEKLKLMRQKFVQQSV